MSSFSLFFAKVFTSRPRKGPASIFPGISYEEALGRAGIVSFCVHQNVITKQLFDSICKNENKKLHNLLLSQPYILRRHRKFAVWFVQTKRFEEI